jgi:hypothetical protein
MLNLQPQLNDAVQHWRERLSCRAPGCQASRRIWRRISDGAGSIQIHGLRHCFPTCFERELQRRFEEMRTVPRPRPRPPHRVPLGLLLLSRGELNPTQLRQALRAQYQSGSGRIGEWLQTLGFAREQQVTAALAAQWSCPVLRTLPTRPADCAVPFPLLRHFRMVPAHYVTSTRILHMAFAAGIEYGALVAIEQMLECKTAPCLASSAALEAVLARMEEEQRPDQVFEGARDPEEMTRISSSYAAKTGAVDVRLVLCGEYIWVRMQGRNASTNLLFSKAAAEMLIPHESRCAAVYPYPSRMSKPVSFER